MCTSQVAYWWYALGPSKLARSEAKKGQTSQAKTEAEVQQNKLQAKTFRGSGHDCMTSRAVVAGCKNTKLAHIAHDSLKGCPHAKPHAENEGTEYDYVVDPDGERPSMLPPIPAPALTHVVQIVHLRHCMPCTNAVSQSTCSEYP